jgi:hypothetical protein
VARVAVTVEDLVAGTLPPFCAKTGAPADGFASVEFTSTPAWTWILLLFGILPFLIARAFSRVRVVGLVPMSDAALRRGRVFTWTYLGAFALGIVLIVIAVASESSIAAVSGVVALIAALLTRLHAEPADVVDALPADGAVENDLLEFPFEIGLHRQQLGAQHLRGDDDLVRPVEAGGHRLVDDRIGVRGLFNHAAARAARGCLARTAACAHRVAATVMPEPR